MAERIYYKSRQEWLELRQNGIGASEIGAVLGLNPYTKANDVYYQKIQKVVVDEKPNKFMQIGNDLEPVIVEKYKAHTGFDVEIYKECIFYNPENAFLLASLDGIIVRADGTRGIFEAKTSRSMSILTKAPPWYYAQVQQQMYVMDLDWAHLVTHYYKINKTKILQIRRDDDFIKDMVKKGGAFWEIVEHARKEVYSLQA